MARTHSGRKNSIKQRLTKRTLPPRNSRHGKPIIEPCERTIVAAAGPTLRKGLRNPRVMPGTKHPGRGEEPSWWKESDNG